MVLEPQLVLLLVLLGGWAGVDGNSVGQFMVSRPVVASTLAGWLAGDPTTGALIGLILEALNLTVLPVGAARYPELGPAAVVAGGVAAKAGGGVAVVSTAVLFALLWGWLSASAVWQLRHLNIRLMAGAVLRDGSPGALERRHLGAIALDFGRACALTALGMVLLVPALALAADAWALPPGVGEAALWCLVAAGIAATLRLFGERRAPLFAVGAVFGLLVLGLL